MFLIQMDTDYWNITHKTAYIAFNREQANLSKIYTCATDYSVKVIKGFKAELFFSSSQKNKGMQDRIN